MTTTDAKKATLAMLESTANGVPSITFNKFIVSQMLGEMDSFLVSPEGLKMCRAHATSIANAIEAGKKLTDALEKVAEIRPPYCND